MDKIIKVKGVTKEYVSDTVNSMVLKGVEFEIKKGEIVAVVGKSGSGKSTLMNIITGIDKPTSGEVYIDNIPIHSLSEGSAAKWRGINMGVVFQFFQLLPTLTVAENIMLPMDFCGVYLKSERKKIAEELMRKTGIEEHRDKLPNELSGGQQQRAAIARALANNPKLIIADEPTGNLDSVTAKDMYKLFKTLAKEGKTVVIVSHDKEIGEVADRVINISDGMIL